MTDWLAGICLLSGALVSLLAAVGVLRLPDAFMRMHAATKSGVVGCGLILIGVAVADGSLATYIKISLATLFLLFTTPVAAHLLGRAAYISGTPFWAGTIENQLAPVLNRHFFGPVRFQGSLTPMTPKEDLTNNGGSQKNNVEKIILALAQGPHLEIAIAQAISLAEHHHAELCGVAIVDKAGLLHVGPVPMGAGYHASELRKWRIAQARNIAADVVKSFESLVAPTGVKFSIQVEECEPHVVLQAFQSEKNLVAVVPGGWFDQGVVSQNVNVIRRLVNQGVHPVLVLGREHKEVGQIRFIYDGSARSLKTWRWMLNSDLWSNAKLALHTTSSVSPAEIEQILKQAHDQGRQAEVAHHTSSAHEYLVIGNADSCGLLAKWFGWRHVSNNSNLLAIG